MSGTRHRLPNRRASIVVGFVHEGIRWTARGSFFPDGTLAELFLTGGKGGSAVQVAAVTASLALQYGVPVNVIQSALIKDANGSPTGPLGAGIEAILAAMADCGQAA